MSQLTYTEVQRELQAANSMAGASEAHGTLAGALCAVVSYGLDDWLGEILPDLHGRRADEETLRTLFDETAHALDERQMGFGLLLPGDDRPLDERAAALGQWCQGFLYGLGSSRIADLERLPGEVGEVVRDLAQISQVGVSADESIEAQESAYTELVEFVRVGAQLVYEELAPYREPPPEPPRQALH